MPLWLALVLSFSAEASDLLTCVDLAVKGSPNCQEASCRGLKQSMENFRKKSSCLRGSNDHCAQWGHEGQSQAKWLSLAAAHLGAFGVCITNHYGAEDEGGYERAMADSSFMGKIKAMEDGSSAFQLLDSSLLLETLDQKRRFSTVLKNSPLALQLTIEELEVFIVAADNPIPLQVEEESILGSTVIQAKTLRAQKTRDATLYSAKTKREPTALPPKIQPKIPTKIRLTIDSDLFARVSSAYQRNARELRGIDDYLKMNPPPPAKDISELLRRGGSL